MREAPPLSSQKRRKRESDKGSDTSVMSEVPERSDMIGVEKGEAVERTTSAGVFGKAS